MGVQFKALKYVMYTELLKKNQKTFFWTIGQFEFEYFGGSDVVNKLLDQYSIIFNIFSNTYRPLHTSFLMVLRHLQQPQLQQCQLQVQLLLQQQQLSKNGLQNQQLKGQNEPLLQCLLKKILF